MLKHRSKIKKINANLLGGGFLVEHKVYVPRGQVNTSFFNVYRIIGETEWFYQTEVVPLVEMQIVRNHLAKARGEAEWSFDFLYNADADNTWVALGVTDPDAFLRGHTETFIKIIQNREEDYTKKMANRKELMAARKKLKEEAKASA